LRHILNYISRSISFNIDADDKLKAVFNGKLKGSMFEMNKLVSDTMHPRNGAINTKRIGAQWDEVLGTKSSDLLPQVSVVASGQLERWMRSDLRSKKAAYPALGKKQP
jgi:SWIB/MDM2 domain